MPDNGTSSNGCTTGNKNYSDGRRLPIETNQADMKAHPKCKRMKFIKKKYTRSFIHRLMKTGMANIKAPVYSFWHTPLRSSVKYNRLCSNFRLGHSARTSYRVCESNSLLSSNRATKTL